MSESAEQFLAQFDAARLAGREHDWLKTVREHARDTVKRHGLPRPKDENWKYTPIRPLERRGFELIERPPGRLSRETVDAFGYPGLDCHACVFENGRYRADLSGGGEWPTEVICLPLAQAFDGHGEMLAPFFKRQFTGSEQGFAALNTAFADDGLFVDVPDGVRVDTPLLLLFASSETDKRRIAHPRVIIRLGKDSRMTLIETFAGEEGHQNCTNLLSQFDIGAGAELRHLRVQNEADKAMLVNRTDVAVASEGSYRSFAIDFGGRLVRHDLNVSLNEEQAQCNLNGLYVLRGRQHVDNHTRIDHQVANTRSEEVYKGVLDGHSRGVFNGKVVVHEGADGADAAQTNANLLLSRDAEVDTKPELEIYADDVKCSHGATVGQLDEDALFYLRSRGLEEDEARGLLTYAFCREVVDRLQIDVVRERLSSELMEHLPAGLVAREVS